MTKTSGTTQASPASSWSSWFLTRAACFTEWLLRRGALVRARERERERERERVGRTLNPVQREQLGLARAAILLADRTMDESRSVSTIEGALTARTARQLALSLYREAAYGALASFSPKDLPTDISAALSAVPQDILRDASETQACLDTARSALIERTQAELHRADDNALERDVRVVRKFVHALVNVLDNREQSVFRLLFQRWSRMGIVLATALALVAAVAWLVPRIRPDLAERAHWQASSNVPDWQMEGVGFHPPEGGPNVFFHTQREPSPSLKFDLGRVTPVGYFWIQNRLDCCKDRAVPLVVSVSTDDKQWTEVARSDEPFYYWDASIARRPARYVLFRAPTETMLHFGRIEIR